jgi:hypothetical protein
MALSEGVIVLRKLIDECEQEMNSLLGGRKAASPRIRKSLQDMKALAHQLRSDVMTHVKTMPTASRKSKELPDETAESMEAPMPPVLKPKRVRKPKVAPVPQGTDTEGTTV